MPNQISTLDVTDVSRGAGRCCASLDGSALSAEQAADLAPMFKALGDPVRLRLLSLIAASGSEACVCDLTGEFDLTGPTISHHLKVLREAGLVDCERRGTWVYYWIRPEVLRGMAALLDGAPAPALAVGLLGGADAELGQQRPASRWCVNSCGSPKAVTRSPAQG